MTKFRPKNAVQKVASERRGIKSQKDFEQAMEREGVARTTARHWWIYGANTREAMKAVAQALGASLDDLGG